MRLTEVWRADPERTFELFSEFPADENGFENQAAGLDRERFAVYVHELEEQSRGIGLQPGWVPSSKYILVNDEGAYVGIFNLRHRLNDNLRVGAGHIGYGIAPQYRGRGYATVGLRLTLDKARELGIDEAYLSVHKDNRASLAVQQHCGARIDHEDGLEYYTRISTAPEPGNLPKAEFMFPGPERDRLVGLILAGTKTATAALMIEYEEDDEPLPQVGERSALVDSSERPVAILVTTAVDVIPLGKITDRHAIDEGEGDTTAAAWRHTHESFWNAPEYRNEFADPDFPLNDDSLVVFEHFKVVRLLDSMANKTADGYEQQV